VARGEQRSEGEHEQSGEEDGRERKGKLREVQGAMSGEDCNQCTEGAGEEAEDQEKRILHQEQSQTAKRLEAEGGKERQLGAGAR